MKIKSLIVGFAVLGLAVSSFAQGQINILNGTSSLIQVKDTTTGGVAVNAPSSVYGTRIQFYYSTAGTAPAAIGAAFDTTGWTAIGNLGSAIASNGRFSIGATTTSVNNAAIWLEAVAWTGSYATLATAAQNSATTDFGFSGVFSVVTSDSTTSPAGTPTKTDAALNLLGNIVLQPVPEPTTIALAGLGAASLLLFRRRK